jgi:hypothetical protein
LQGFRRKTGREKPVLIGVRVATFAMIEIATLGGYQGGATALLAIAVGAAAIFSAVP